ncbi:MAG: aminodeoxychorismate lyase [Gammaproteobacteria bacterium]|nr:aminodeoxychorismate lyase [Gammaproteobacteria bacterium]
MKSNWFRDGEPVASVPIDDRALQYGDGLFETIAVRGGQARLWDLHMARLGKGCETLGLETPDAERLLREIDAALLQSTNDDSNCVVKIIVSAGSGQRGYGRSTTTSTVFLGVFPQRGVEADAYANGVSTLLCKTSLAISSVTAGLKTLNRLEQVLGRSECLRASCFEGLMLDAEGRLICGTMSNVFVVSNNSLITPYLGRCGVAGVMRDFAIDVFGRHGIDVSVRDLVIDELWQSDEVFLTNSQFGALPVRSCLQHEFRPGSVTRDCLMLLADHGITECAP